jgi:molybdopterin converting factor subunit 1
MKVSVKLFAVARQWAGADSVELDLPAAATVAAVRQALLTRLPQLAQFGSQLRFAVNADYADDSLAVPAGSDVACIPPVSGG